MPLLYGVNKAQAVTWAGHVPDLHPLNFASAYRDASADNVLIQRDNLLALKARLPFHRGRVACIYIDAARSRQRTPATRVDTRPVRGLGPRRPPPCRATVHRRNPVLGVDLSVPVVDTGSAP